MTPNRVSRACVRCRKQKLKCDVGRPCLLCTRAGVDCVAGQIRAWKQCEPAETSARNTREFSGGQRKKRSRVTPRAPAERVDERSHRRSETADKGATSNTHAATARPADYQLPASVDNGPWRSSSSTINLVQEAFRHHDSSSPKTSETSALGYGQRQIGPRLDVSPQEARQRATVTSHHRPRPTKISRPAVSELTQLLPTRGVSHLLVNNYFDKIHWFMLLFHQREFKESLDAIYPSVTFTSSPTGTQDGHTIGYVSVLLAACAVSLRYVSSTQQNQLAEHGVHAESLRERILTTLRLRLLDVLALGSLEAVQMCVLLGSYYLYHGEPELAWPLCGCALRLAQALELHRRPITGPGGITQKETEVRKRCWWAVHEMETFCSMVYGFPLSFSDTDCDVEPLDPSDPWSIAADGQPPSNDQPTLLVYKCSMSNLSKIVKSALEGLYGFRQRQHRATREVASRVEQSVRLQPITEKIASLNDQLVQWYAELPPKLRVGRLSDRAALSGWDGQAYDSTSHGSFEEKLFQLQALALKLAFENARILIHRPLLSAKRNDVSETSGRTRQGTSKKATASATSSRPECPPNIIHTCRDAALQISWTGQAPIFKEASTTYALNFISLHLLTAGVTLCMLTGSDPLTRDSLDSKLGVRRVMEMQASLRCGSIVAAQGLQILKKLLSLVLRNETHSLLEVGSEESDGYRVQAEAGSQGHSTPEVPLAHLGENCADLNRPRDDVATLERTVHETQPLWSEPTRQPTNSFNLLQDMPMAQAMLDIEQAFMYPYHSISQDEQATLSATGFMPGYPTIGQDQVWLWDPLLDIGALE